jgi:hypothetical protein
MSDSSRFDPERVEWTKTTWSDDPVKPGKMTGPQWIENNTTVPVWLSLTNLPVAVLPATTYRELYEAAEAMAEAIEGFIEAEVQIERSGGASDMQDYAEATHAAADALTTYREGETA